MRRDRQKCLGDVERTQSDSVKRVRDLSVIMFLEVCTCENNEWRGPEESQWSRSVLGGC